MKDPNRTNMNMELNSFTITLIICFIGALVRFSHDREKSKVSFWRFFFIMISALGVSHAIYTVGKEYNQGDMIYVYAFAISLFMSDIIKVIIEHIPNIIKLLLDTIVEKGKKFISKF